MSVDVEHWAERLFEAAVVRRPIAPISDSVALTVDDAYAIQAALVARRLAAGERIVGAKVGLTSKAKQQQMGVDSPVFGWLFSASRLGADGVVACDELIHPRVEPEIVFVLGCDLEGPDVTGHDVLDAASVVCGGIEVIDSRYEAFRFTLPDVIADNTSVARFAVGSHGLHPRERDLALLGCLFEVGGDLVATAAGAALLGHPAESVAALANHLARDGRRLEAGWTVLAGSLTDAVALARGTSVAATFAHLGRVGVVGR